MKQINGKIRVTQRDINKVLDYISTYKNSKDGLVLINDDFYNGLPRMNKVRINQAINSLNAVNAVEVYQPTPSVRVSSLRLTSEAFVYKLHKKQNDIRFIIPTVISIIALVGAYRQELSWLLQSLMQLMK